MYFYENKNQGYFVLKNIHGDYLKYAPGISCYDMRNNQKAQLVSESVNVISKAKKYKRSQDLLLSIRNLMRNSCDVTFYDAKHREIAHRLDYEFESQYWLGSESFTCKKDQIQYIDFSMLDNVEVVFRDTMSKTNTVMKHDFNAFLKHCFYRSRAADYFGHPLTNLMLKHPNFTTENPQKVVILGFQKNSTRNVFATDALHKATIKGYFKNQKITNKDISLEIVDACLAIIVHNREKMSLIQDILTDISECEFVNYTVGDVLATDEVDFHALQYKQPQTPIVDSSCTP